MVAKEDSVTEKTRITTRTVSPMAKARQRGETDGRGSRRGPSRPPKDGAAAEGEAFSVEGEGFTSPIYLAQNHGGE